MTATRLYGTTTARAWNRLHPRLTHRSAWTSQLGALPVIEGTVIRLRAGHLPSGATPKPVWLWWSGTGTTTADVDRLRQAFLRRFDIEHTFRLFKQTLGWTCPKTRTPEAADRWTWLIIVASTRPARPPAADPPAAVGKADPTRQAHPPRPRPSRLSAPAAEGRLPGRSTETPSAWPGTATRPQEQPAHRTP